jgi:hypothetical protein
MRSGTIAVAFMVLVANTSPMEAAPHHGGNGGGGGHAAAPPKAPHFSPPPAAHFSQAQAVHSNAMNQGGYNSGYTPNYRQPRHSTANGTKAHTKLHMLANALQENSQAHKSKSSSTQTTSAQAKAQTSAVQNGAVAAGSSSSSIATSAQYSTSTTRSASTTTSNGQAPITGVLSLNSTSTTPTSTGAKPLGVTGTNLGGTKVPGTSTGTTSTASSGTTTTQAATNPNGIVVTLAPASNALMSHLNAMFDVSTVGGSNFAHRHYVNPYWSRYYGNRNYYNRNNSMYFSQMMRLSQLVNALNSLRPGLATNMSHTSRLQGVLMGVAMGNARPPAQAVNQLSMDLVMHLPNRTTPMMNTGQLARDLMIAMNGSGQNGGQVQNAISSANSVLNVSGVNQQGIQRIGNDMMMVASWGGNGIHPIARIR